MNYRKEISISCIRYIGEKHINSHINLVTSKESDTVTLDAGGIKYIVEKDQLVRTITDLTYDYYDNKESDY